MGAKPQRDSSITYFPVGNADTSLIALDDGANIVVDLCVTVDSKDGEKRECYDVHAHLLRELPYDGNGNPHVDAFIQTHPDQDHLRGFTTAFFVGSPSSYGVAHRKAGRIIIDELWFAPRVFCGVEKKLCPDAIDFRKEARRRMELHRARSPERNLPGNRIRIIGFTDSDELDGLDDVVTTPGRTISVINGIPRSTFEFFVHGPFKDDTDDSECERNHTSVVLQARFTVDGVSDACLAMFGGDAGCPVWERILARSDDRALKWDLLLAPHHCSWTFFSELPSETKQPSSKVLEFLDKRRDGAIVIASSKRILDDDDNPPHYIAAELFRERVGSKSVLCTAENKKDGVPVPIVMGMTQNGPVRDSSRVASQIVSSAAVRGTVAEPKTYG